MFPKLHLLYWINSSTLFGNNKDWIFLGVYYVLGLRKMHENILFFIICIQRVEKDGQNNCFFPKYQDGYQNIQNFMVIYALKHSYCRISSFFNFYTFFQRNFDYNHAASSKFVIMQDSHKISKIIAHSIKNLSWKLLIFLILDFSSSARILF